MSLPKLLIVKDMQHTSASSVILRITLLILLPLFILVLTPMIADARVDGEIYAKSNGDLNGSTGKMDYQGYTYKVVKIGTQWWMAENLRATRYNDGTEIPHVMSHKEWRRLKKTKSGALCNYNNDPAFGNEFGILYNWYAVNTGKLAPPGWHVPNNEDWQIFANNMWVIKKIINGPLASFKVTKNTLALTDKSSPDFERSLKMLKDASAIIHVDKDEYTWYSLETSGNASDNKYYVMPEELILLAQKMLSYEFIMKLRQQNISGGNKTQNAMDDYFGLREGHSIEEGIGLLLKDHPLNFPRINNKNIHLLNFTLGRSFLSLPYQPWDLPGTNISGFTALPSGSRYPIDFPAFVLTDENAACFWATSTEKGRRPAILMKLHDFYIYRTNTYAETFFFAKYFKETGASVRCVLN